ncbi:autorepressor SdpR family transcription factor [Asticcacaulis sp. BYS171W]|uniref:Autorepressor SdpR family transcription factor n=1 Tax=Asticcacaulis aquaticus TaxID=2984212 RepID=A0ABT5HRB2_9CAUL|nr:autorepressor SdpR family transcription factor [Asticcacaulis aquaticus]MDC7682606.1 autorepressor SdpR family transcription factor [Asticcacaulis aquaticus]
MSEVYKALSDPTRRQILEMLRDREMSAGDIADRVAVSKPTLSGHLSTLKAAGLIDVTRQGTSLIYRLNVSVLEEAIMALMSAFRIGQTVPSAAHSADAKGETI